VHQNKLVGIPQTQIEMTVINRPEQL